jgi:hypothetical protein
VPLVMAATSACGGGAVAAAAEADEPLVDFECNRRRAEYMVVGGFVAPESGVTMDCAHGQPRIVRWRSDGGAEQIRSAHPLTAEQFEATWEKIDATGWRFLARTCAGSRPAGKKPRGPRQPIYTIDVGDSSSSVSLSCTGVELPFPYDRLVNELDLRAAGFGDDAGSPH